MRFSKYKAVRDYYPPARLRQIAEERIAEFVAAYESATPRPPLLDLCVSAYLQGVNDAADAAAREVRSRDGKARVR